MPTKVDLKELRGMEPNQLQTMVEEMEVNLLKLEFDQATKGIDNPMDIKTMRRDIARVKTIHREKELVDVDPATRKKIRNRRRNK